MVVLSALSVPAAADESFEWRESFLVLSTGRAPYRALYEEASRNIAGGSPESLLHLAEFFDAGSSREWMAIYRVASDMGPAAGPPLLDAADAAATDTSRWSLIVCYGVSRDSGSIDRIAKYVDSPDRRVRAAVALVLGSMGLSSSRSLLEAGLHDTEAAVRRIAADALGVLLSSAQDETEQSALRETLEPALLDPDPWVRRNARRHLAAKEK